MNILLRYTIIALVLALGVLGAVGLSDCADELCIGCAHGCCVPGMRTRSVRRLLQRVKTDCRSCVEFVLILRGGPHRLAATHDSGASLQSLDTVTALRI